MSEPENDREILTAGDYIIRRTDSGDYWIESHGGEGMQTPRAKFERLIDEFYRREF